MAKRSRSARAGTVEPPRGPAAGKPGRAPAPWKPPPPRTGAPGALARLLAWLATPRGYAVGAAVMIALAMWARFATWSWIFGSGRVELLPSDSHYYVRLARLHLAARGPVPFDPFVGFPSGSENYWPHLHTLLVTLAAALGPDPETGAAFVGPVASLLWFAAIAWAAYRALGGPGAVFALFLLALTPLSVEAGKVGNADHNVHEAMVAALLALLAIRAVRGSTAAALGAGALAGAGRLFTTTGFVFSGVLALSYAAASAAGAPAARAGVTRRAALSGAACVVVLALAVLALGHPTRLDYEALTLFHPLLAAALFGVALAACAWLEGRPTAALAYAALGLALVPIVPQLLVAAGHLARHDPLLAVVSESQPLLTRPGLALALLGPALLALPFAFWGAARGLRAQRAAELAVPVVCGAIFLVGAAAQSRLGLFLVGAAAALLPLGLGRALGALSPGGARWASGVAAVAFAVLLLMLVPPAAPRGPGPAALIRPTLLWMRDHLPPASSAPWDYRVQPTYGVLAPFDYGHFITLYAERPVLASPFSQTDAHVEANRVASDILSSTDEEAAYERMRALGLRFVLAAPSQLFGAGPLPTDALLPRLIRRDSFGRFEPLYVSSELRAGGGRYATVFEVVQGAVLTGRAPPGVAVRAELADGYARSGVADPNGAFAIRVARPGAYALSADGARGPLVAVTQDQVGSGATVDVGPRR